MRWTRVRRRASGGARRGMGALALALVAATAVPAGAEPAAPPSPGRPEVAFPAADASGVGPERREAGVKPEEIRRQRFAHVSRASVQKALRGAAAQPIALRLFDDVDLVVTTGRVEESPGSYYWHGEVGTGGQTLGWVDYTESSGTSSMSVSLLDGREFAVAPTGVGDVARVVELNSSPVRKAMVLDDAVPGRPAPPGSGRVPVVGAREVAAAAAPATSAATLGSASTIDLLVVYTPLARSEAGGPAQVQNQIQAAVNSANTALGNSGAFHRIRLVRSYETSTYNASQSMGASLAALSSLSDGPLDEVYGERNATGADVVTLWNDFSDACGLGNLLGPGYLNGTYDSFEFNQFAFNVVDNSASCNGGWNTLAHEIGHNLGAEHDRSNTVNTPAFPYSYGYRRTASPSPFIDVMSFRQNGCEPCPKVPYFSTPNRTFNGYPVGTAGEDVVRTFNNTSLAASEWRFSAADVVGVARQTTGPGYWTVSSSGAVRAFAGAPFAGDLLGVSLSKPIVGMAADQDGTGYYLTASDGGIFAFQAPFYGSTGGVALSKPVVGMAADPDGAGYWLVASDGGIFAFQSSFYGSTGGISLSKPVVGMAADPDRVGYWLVASDGGIFAYQAQFSGSMGGVGLSAPVIGMAAPSSSGYWLLGEDGGVFSFRLPFYGNGSGGAPMASIAARAGGTGYLLARRDGNYGSGSVLVRP